MSLRTTKNNTGSLGSVSVTAVVPGTGATQLGKAEDAAHTGGDTGVMALAVRQDTAAALAGTDGDYIPIIVDASGRLHVNVGNIAAGTNAIGKLAANSGVDIGDVDVTSVTPGTAAASLGKAEDAAHTSGDVGVMALGVQQAVSAATGAEGDYAPLQLDSRGQLHVGVPKASVSTDVSLASAATSAQLLGANTARTGLLLTNTDANSVYVYYGTTATSTKFSVIIPANGYWEMPQPIYTGRIDAIWAADGSGSLIGTELAN